MSLATDLDRHEPGSRGLPIRPHHPHSRRSSRVVGSNGKISHDAFHSRGGQEIRAYTTRDSIRHVFHGFAIVHGDTIQFTNFPGNEWGEQSAPRPEIELPLDQVLSVDKAETNVPATVALIVLFGALLAIAVIGAALASEPPIPPI